MAEQLALVDLGLDHAMITLFPAARPDDPGQFPSIGARGCFMSHLGVLKNAKIKGYSNILILEDDANFAPGFLNSGEKDAAILEGDDWDILYFGYDIHGEISEVDGENSHFLHLSPSTGVGLTHALMIRQQTIEEIILYFEAMMARPDAC